MSTSDAKTGAMRGREKLSAYFELFRVPNVFTAMADVLMGFLVTQQTAEPAFSLALLLAASCLLYTSGMVLNDVFDLERDRGERPGRPLPSGRIDLSTARRLGFGMLIAGVVLGSLAGWSSGALGPGVVAALLAGAVLLYDGWLKRTIAGPLGMGLCRALNVLLGMSVAAAALEPRHWLIAAGVGTYIVGVTWFARTEARKSSRTALTAATLVMTLGIVTLYLAPRWHNPATAPVDALARPTVDPRAWTVLMTALGALILWRPVRAILEPVPGRVQVAVAQCILSLIVLDAAVTYALCGTEWSVVVILLVLPAFVLGRRFAST